MEADTYTAKTHLSRLLDQVERGEEVIITRRGKKIARLVRYAEKPAPLVMGLLKHKLQELDPTYDKHQDPEWQAMIDEMETKPIF